MDSMTAFAKGQANRDKELMVFDWIKAAQRIKETGCKEASAGLRDDWEWTGGNILENGKIPDNSHTFLASTWASPQLAMDGEIEDCFIMQSKSPGGSWDCDTFWPDEAKQILGL
jgi:hypothetical protein